MNDVYRMIDVMEREKDETFIMASVIRVYGSAYRHEGAKMLIGTEGKCYGTISAGCLEEDLLYRAEEVRQSMLPQIVTYDLRSENDLGWGQGAGCNGQIDIYLEPLCWNTSCLFNGIVIFPYIHQKLKEGKGIISVRLLNEDASIYAWGLCCEDGEIVGITNQELIERSMAYASDVWQTRSNVYINTDNITGRDVLVEKYEPKDLLYIFGAGPDAEPLARLASQMDFSVTVVDPRSARCSEENFPTVDRRITEHPGVYLQTERIPERSFVISMTHNFQWDRQILEYFSHHPTRYLGILGPRRRTERLNEGRKIPEWMHSPIGLKIGAEGPDEISVSIMAELIQVRSGITSKEKQATSTKDRDVLYRWLI